MARPAHANPSKPHPPLTGSPRYDQPCAVWDDEKGDVCGAMPTQQFLNWRGCINHTPAALAGHEEPGAMLKRSRALTEKWEAEKAAARPEPSPEPPVLTTPRTDPQDVQPVQRSIETRRTRDEQKAAAKNAIADAKAAATAAREAGVR